MIDTLRRVSEAVNPYTSAVEADKAGVLNGTKAEVHRHLDAVVEKSGPGPFTDSVLRCKLCASLFRPMADRFRCKTWVQSTM